jgi:hypothetical protein
MKCDEPSALAPPELCELQEETGFRAASWRYLCSTQAVTMVRYLLHYFLATVLSLLVVVNGSSASGKSRLIAGDDRGERPVQAAS